MRKLFVLLAAIILAAVCVNATNASAFVRNDERKTISDTPVSESEDSLLINLDSIIVLSSRAGINTPVTYSTITKKNIEKSSATHSLPMLLGYEPSVVATTEGGLGLGYSKFSVRGSDPSRTNITLNGIAINDGESQEVFWVNLPALSGVLQSVQLQRGVGTSSNGPGQFGAAMNMQTISPNKAYGKAEFSFGSYNTYMSTIASGSGLMGKGKNKFFTDLSYAHNLTRGYIRNAKANLDMLFAQAGWMNDNNELKFVFFYGDQTTGITWEGCPIDIYESGNRKYNVTGEYYDDEGKIHYYDNDTDNYTQKHYQLHYIHRFSDELSLNATLHYTKGDGYYENYKYDTKFSKYNIDNQVIDGVIYEKSDFIIRQQMDNAYYVGNTNVNYNNGVLKINGGLSYSFYDGDHFGRVVWSKYNANIPQDYEWYLNNGKKNDLSTYIKAEREIAENLTLYADIQYRYVKTKMKGIDKDIADMTYSKDYNFLNSKAGINYKFNDWSKVYFSFAVGQREPNRSDVKESIKAGKTDEIKSEKLVDYELGYVVSTQKFDASLNLYAMEYKDQLVATGRLTETGYTIQENVPDSYRRGIEIAFAYRPTNSLEFRFNATFSKNKLKNYTMYSDTNDNPDDWNPLPQTETFFKKSNISFSPEFVSMASVNYTPCKDLNLSLNFKQVGKQYMDNSSSRISKVPYYNNLNFSASKIFKFKKFADLKVAMHVDNILNRKYYSYGWIYTSKFADGSPDYVEKAVFSQATTNYIISVALMF